MNLFSPLTKEQQSEIILPPQKTKLNEAQDTALNPTRIYEIPHIKKEIFKQSVQKQAWDDFTQQADNLSISNQNKKIIGIIYAMEGGVSKHPGSSKTVAGITSTILKEGLDKNWIQSTSDETGKNILEPADLSAKQRVQIYTSYLNAAFGKGQNGGLAILDKYPPKVASHMADTVFRAGISGGGKMIEEAINRSGGHTAIDGKVQDNALKALDSLISQGKQNAFLNNLSDVRNEIYRDKGDTLRSDYFRPDTKI